MFGGGALVAGKLVADPDVATPATHAPSLPTPQPTLASPQPTTSVAAAPTQPPRVRPDDGTDVQDLTWISTETGWALGFVLDCAHVGGDASVPSCYTILHTVDGGQSWDKIASLSDPAQQGASGPNSLRFGSPSVGYLILSGRLSITTDGGRTWRPSALRSVLAVEAARAGAVILTGEALCGPCRVLRAPLGSLGWKQTLDVPYGSARLRRSGNNVLVGDFANPAGGADDKSATVYRSTDGGQTWVTGADPCAGVHINGEQRPFATDFQVSGHVELAVCQDYTFAMDQHTFVMVSDTGGRRFGPWRDTPCDYGRFSAASATVLLCPSQDGIHVSDDGGATWRLTLPAGPHANADGCGFQTAEVGRCVLGVTIYTTRDAGRTWNARDVSAS
jgi:photosystem II stability/assembly factor-like uncharacterized protein